MKRIALLLYIALVSSGCEKKKVDPEVPALETIFPDNVNGIPDKNKVLLIDEDFNSNNNAWRIFYEPNNDINYMKIERGLYIFYNDGRGTMLNHTNGLNFDQSKDFEIETKLKATTREYGLFWASNDLSGPGLSNMLIFEAGKMDFVSAEADGEKYIVRDKIVESTADAIIKIRKIKDKYYFFLNQNLVYQGPYLPSKGQSIGFYFSGRGNFESDYIRISRINI